MAYCFAAVSRSVHQHLPLILKTIVNEFKRKYNAQHVREKCDCDVSKVLQLGPVLGGTFSGHLKDIFGSYLCEGTVLYLVSFLVVI